jgi:hypothetical protein
VFTIHLRELNIGIVKNRLVTEEIILCVELECNVKYLYIIFVATNGSRFRTFLLHRHNKGRVLQGVKRESEHEKCSPIRSVQNWSPYVCICLV